MILILLIAVFMACDITARSKCARNNWYLSNFSDTISVKPVMYFLQWSLSWGWMVLLLAPWSVTSFLPSFSCVSCPVRLRGKSLPRYSILASSINRNSCSVSSASVSLVDYTCLTVQLLGNLCCKLLTFREVTYIDINLLQSYQVAQRNELYRTFYIKAINNYNNNNFRTVENKYSEVARRK